MADRLKLAAGLRNLPETAREDLAGREQDIQRGKTVELLRRAGKEMYENPIVNTAVGLSPVLGDIQAGVEAYRSAEAGDWGNAGLNAMGMLPFIPMLGKTVWHGSPHSFEKFDLSKIGTGEGAQAYGHGLYLADRQGEAMKYAPRDMAYEDKLMKHYSVAEKINDYPTMQVYEDFLTQKTPDEVMESLAEAGFQGKDLEKAQKALANATGLYQGQTASHMYKVDLPDEKIAQMIDYYKPFSEQSEYVRNALEKAPFEVKAGGDYSGAELYDMAQSYAADTIGQKNPAAGSNLLNELGIPGIKYTEQKYLAKPHMTPNYNYVVFDENLPQVLERNNQPVAQALRNYEAPKQALDVTKQDASDIFGEGASRIRYQDPNTQGFIDVLQRPDGTASVLGLEVPEAARGKGVGQSLQQQVLSDFPEMQGQVSSKAAATTAHRIGRRPVGNPEATLDDVFRMIDEDSSVNLVSPEMQKRFNFGG